MSITRIPKGLKLNKFEMAVIPPARKLVSIYGFASSPANLYSGDNTSGKPLDKVHAIKEGLRVLNEGSTKNE